ncbi:protein FtsZ [Pasteurella multocida subsp. septica]|nr:protein FtsZ [Pasteurella multocida subsp. septica]
MFEPVDYDLGEMDGALIKVVGVGGGAVTLSTTW